MICNMQFVENGTSFTISEATEDDKVNFTMGDGDNDPYCQFIQLDVDNLVRLRDWLNESIKTLTE